RRLSMAGKRTNTIRAVYGKTEDTYLDLIRQFPLRPLRTDADLDAAVAVIDALIDRPELTAPEEDYLDVLSDLVETYEGETVPMRPVGDADLLRFLIEQKSVTQVEAASGAGSLNPPSRKCWPANASSTARKSSSLAGTFTSSQGHSCQSLEIT